MEEEREIIALGNFFNHYPNLKGKEGEKRQEYLEILYKTKKFPVFISGEAKHNFFDNNRKEVMSIQGPIGTPLEFAPLTVFPKKFSFTKGYGFEEFEKLNDEQAFVYSLWHFYGKVSYDQSVINHEKEIMKKIMGGESVIKTFRILENELRELNQERCALLNLFIKDNKFVLPQYKNLRDFGHDLVSKGVVKEEDILSKDMFLFYKGIEYRNLEKLTGNFLNGKALVAEMDGVNTGYFSNYCYNDGLYGIISTDELSN